MDLPLIGWKRHFFVVVNDLGNNRVSFIRLMRQPFAIINEKYIWFKALSMLEQLKIRIYRIDNGVIPRMREFKNKNTYSNEKCDCIRMIWMVQSGT